ncbi:hypothetical protein Pelo_18850 [Pelomyxa schiedti]|nr:hypothetical protein Pelo_18850 [Pelomyxa schiedti]
MLFAVISPKESAASFLVVDVESTHTSGTLRILSTTHVFPLRRNDGALSFITDEVGVGSFQVEQSTGAAVQLQKRRDYPLSSSEFFSEEIAQVNGSLNVPIWNCNDRSQTPSRFVKLPTTATAVTGANTPDASHEVTGSHGFLFHVDRAQFRISVIDASTTSTCTAHPPPLVPLVPEDSSVTCISFLDVLIWNKRPPSKKAWSSKVEPPMGIFCVLNVQNCDWFRGNTRKHRESPCNVGCDFPVAPSIVM